MDKKGEKRRRSTEEVDADGENNEAADRNGQQLIDELTTGGATGLPYDYPHPSSNINAGIHDGQQQREFLAHGEPQIDPKQIEGNTCGPDFKDQFREASSPSEKHQLAEIDKIPINSVENQETLPDDIPIAMANLVSPSEIRREVNTADDRDEEIRRLEMQVQHLQASDGQQQVVSDENKQRNKFYGWTFAILILCSGVLVAGICGTGQCSRSDQIRSVSTVSPAPSEASIGPSQVSLNPPTLNESEEVARKALITAAVNVASLSNTLILYPLPTNPTPEEIALAWLIDSDPAILPGLPSLSLQQRQRYVLACLWFQSIIPFAAPHGKTWLVETDECKWESVGCDVNGEITALDLDEDNVHGTIPFDIGLLTRLTMLQLSGNSMSGTLPTTLGLLTNVRFMDLSENSFSGAIPNQIISMLYLKEAWFYNNMLSGTNPFCSLNKTFSFMEADCNEVACECCTECCPNGGWDGIPGELLNRCDA